MAVIQHHWDIVIVGAGLAGISAAAFLSRIKPNRRIAIVDQLAPMSFTTAQSGDNFRNWWPHPTMTAFTDASIDLMEKISGKADIHWSPKGYLLVTRDDSTSLLKRLVKGYDSSNQDLIRVHPDSTNGSDVGSADLGVDVYTNRNSIQKIFPHLTAEIRTVAHVRRAGYLSGQQLGQVLLDQAREKGVCCIRSKVEHVDRLICFELSLASGEVLKSEQIVIAAGPFVNSLVSQIEEPLPVVNVLQQKLAFVDDLGAISRDQPFTIDLDSRLLDWTNEERELLESDPASERLTRIMPGGVHCRPEGNGRWIKLGWAFNRTDSDPQLQVPLNDLFPELAVRRAGMMIPALEPYRDRLPPERSHYGGYYTITAENWPLIGPLRTPGAFVISALSGFGTMAACAAGSLCSDWITGGPLPAYARSLSTQRYDDKELMQRLSLDADKGLL